MADVGTIVGPEPLDAEDDLTAQPEPGRDASDVGATGLNADVDSDTAPDPQMLLPLHPTMYPTDRTLSPITRHVVEGLRQIAQAGSGLRDDVFAKVGASNTVNPNFMGCFAGPRVDLDGRDHLRGTIDHFLAGDADGTTPYQRESLAARVGASADWTLSGRPSPLEREVGALRPRFALVHFGTNDVQRDDLHGYAAALLNIVDRLAAGGTIPVLTTLPPRADSATATAQVPLYRAATWAVAQARQVPLVDLWRELAPLPDKGLGPDGVHLDSLAPGQACVFTPAGLQHGHNVRNLHTMEILAALHQTVVRGEDVLDESGPERVGDGSPVAPILIERLPFADVRDTRAAGLSRIDGYPACDGGQDEGGPELLYQLILDRSTALRAFVFDRGSVDIDLHLLTDGADPESCIQRAHKEIAVTLQPGRYTFSLDTYVGSGGEVRAGEYIFLLMEDPGAGQ